MFNYAFSDIFNAIKKIKVALFFAWLDTISRYQRTMLGPFWLTFGTLFGVIGLTLVWSEILNIPKSVIFPQLAAGLILWQLVSACISEGVTVFIFQEKIIRNIKFPLFFHPLQLVSKHLINFFHNVIIYFFVILYFDIPINLNTLFILITIPLLIINLLWMVLMLGILGARFKDIQYAVPLIIPILFFISPVMYRANMSIINNPIVKLNPLTYFIEIIRQPLMGQAINQTYFLGALSIAFLGWFLTLLMFNSKIKRIVFWI